MSNSSTNRRHAALSPGRLRSGDSRGTGPLRAGMINVSAWILLCVSQENPPVLVIQTSCPILEQAAAMRCVVVPRVT